MSKEKKMRILRQSFYRSAAKLTRKAMNSQVPKERELYLEQAQACLREVESML